MTMNEVLLRGTTIKNSGAVHGLVIYTGPESRIQMNAARPPKKTGKLQELHFYWIAAQTLPF